MTKRADENTNIDGSSTAWSLVNEVGHLGVRFSPFVQLPMRRRTGERTGVRAAGGRAGGRAGWRAGGKAGGPDGYSTQPTRSLWSGDSSPDDVTDEEMSGDSSPDDVTDEEMSAR